jgi:hypothetical protein
MSARDHSRVVASSSPVVEAFVTSAPTAPVSQYASRSGISSSVRAATSCAVSRAAASWNTVLNGRCCSPLIRYSSSGPTAACTAGTAVSCRASR